MSDKILFIGKMPPPIGGVTTFNSRMSNLLKIENKVKIIEPKYANLLNILINIKKYKQIHVSASNIRLLAILAIIATSNTIIFYDHNSSRHFYKLTKYQKNIINYFLMNRCKKIMLVSNHLDDNYKFFNSYEKIKSKFQCISAFLPPSKNELPYIIKTYDKELQLIYTKLEHIQERKVILTNAYQPCLDDDNNDLYSIDLLIDMFRDLSEKFQNYYFIIAIGSYNQSKFSLKIKDKVKDSKAAYPNLIFIEGNKQIWPLFKFTKLFIRATTTDGDSISLQEALYFNAPSIASNVVPRPKGTDTFDLRTDSIKNIIIEKLK